MIIQQLNCEQYNSIIQPLYGGGQCTRHHDGHNSIAEYSPTNDPSLHIPYSLILSIVGSLK